MSISGELPGEGSDGEEEVFIDEEDIIHEITIDEEDLPDRDEEDDDVGDGIGRGGFCLELQLSVYAKFSLSAPPFFCQLASQIVLEEIEKPADDDVLSCSITFHDLHLSHQQCFIMQSNGYFRFQLIQKTSLMILRTHFLATKASCYTRNPTDASLVASGGKDDRGFLWRIGSDEGALELTGHKDTVGTVAFSSDGNLLACGSFDGQINVWNTAARALKGTLEGSGSGFEWLKWHPRGHLIIAGSEDCNVWMWNADHNAIINTFVGHSNTVTCGDFTPDGKLICTGSDDASLRIWDPRSAQSRHVIRDFIEFSMECVFVEHIFELVDGHGYHTDGLTCLSMTLDSQTVVSGSKDSSVHAVNVNSGQIVGSLVGHTTSIECVGISSSYGWVATGSMDQKLIIWDLTHQSSRCTCEHDEGVTSLAWLGSSRYVASGCIDGKVRIWDSLSGDCAREFSGHADVVQSMAITADGNAMVSVSSDGSARVFDISMFK
ncbi:transducin family protein / WD-40 repeat family protein [Zea mays]|uniref:Transducin family protein / WD-40 repeat family protein n=3 Tax=Zea mays TaxID=4577 RepID=A0A1D6G3U1_MAIZE|nr:transducin family protein / WD-40 repeat family protein [Zea mays]AQK98004.1 transducin family protein / WD-40 repeat family protein [Zea mays]